jgi:hypothetical protein
MDRVVRDAIGVKRGEGGAISVVFAASRFYRVVAGVGDPGHPRGRNTFKMPGSTIPATVHASARTVA